MDALQLYQKNRLLFCLRLNYKLIFCASAVILDLNIYLLFVSFFSQQKIFIEYIMLDGVNDEEQHAHQLGKLLETLKVVCSSL